MYAVFVVCVRARACMCIYVCVSGVCVWCGYVYMCGVCVCVTWWEREGGGDQVQKFKTVLRRKPVSLLRLYFNMAKK